VASKSLCNEFKTRNGLEIKADIASELPPLDDELALCLYRVLQECLQNIVKHAGRCNVNVLLKSSEWQIRLEVSDTGRGFATTAQSTGIGLLIMKERVRSLRGNFKICSRLGEGTHVCVTVPVSGRESLCQPLKESKGLFPASRPPETLKQSAEKLAGRSIFRKSGTRAS
jgi:signal transduction histidine kinase